jgi:hypothetical protein
MPVLVLKITICDHLVDACFIEDAKLCVAWFQLRAFFTSEFVHL